MKPRNNQTLRILSLLLILLLVLPLAACHGAKKEPELLSSPPAALDTETPIEITFWAKNDTNVRQTRVYKKAIEDFQALYPNVKVNLSLYTDYGRIYNDVITNIPTGTTPNVCITYPDHIATYKEGKGTVLPLDGWINDPRYGLGGSELRFDGPTSEEVIGKFLAEGQIDGVQYALPFMRSTEACYINKTYVEALGYTIPEVVTWDFIWEVSDAAMKKNPDGTFAVNGQKTLIPFIYKSTDNMMIQRLRQEEAGYSNEDGTVLIFNDTTRDFLYEIAERATARSFSTFKISGYPGNFFNKGQCLFAIDSTAGASWMGTYAPLSDLKGNVQVEFETVVRPIPQVTEEGTPVMISQGPSVCVFNKENEQEVLASWLFAQFLLTNEVQISYAQTEGYVPVTSKAQASATYQDYLAKSGVDNDVHYSIKIDATKLLLANTENTFITPVFNGSADLRDAGGQLIEEVTKACRRKETVDEPFMEALETKIISLYHLDSQVRREFDSLPTPAILLLSVLGGAWLLIGTYLGVSAWKSKKKMK